MGDVPKVRVDVFDLYDWLWHNVANVPKGKDIWDESFVEFSREEIEQVLGYQVEECDIAEALEECLKAGWLCQDGGIFHITDEGMAIYNSLR